MRAGNGVHAPTDIREVRADDALIDAMGTAPLECGPTVEDGAGGELIGNMMAWRRWLEDEETAPPRGGSVLEELLSAHLAGWVDAARPAAAVASVRAAVAPLCTPAAFRAPSSCRLTRREFEVLAGMARGLSNGQISRELFLSEDTVKTYARRLYRAVGAWDRAHAVARGYQLGILQVPDGT